MTLFVRRLVHALVVVLVAVAVLACWVGIFVLPSPGNAASFFAAMLLVGCIVYAAGGREA